MVNHRPSTQGEVVTLSRVMCRRHSASSSCSTLYAQREAKEYVYRLAMFFPLAAQALRTRATSRQREMLPISLTQDMVGEHPGTSCCISFALEAVCYKLRHRISSARQKLRPQPSLLVNIAVHAQLALRNLLAPTASAET